MTETKKSIQQKTAKAPTITDMLEDASMESDSVQDLLRLAWLGCMNMNDNGHYRFDPEKNDMERNYDELCSVMTVIDECVHKLESLNRKIERACHAAMNRTES